LVAHLEAQSALVAHSLTAPMAAPASHLAAHLEAQSALVAHSRTAPMLAASPAHLSAPQHSSLALVHAMPSFAAHSLMAPGLTAVLGVVEQPIRATVKQMATRLRIDFITFGLLQ